jgi:predicted nuclease of predicted toxin-antitoxin system
MIGRLLIDECLSPELVQLAGHGESAFVRDRGRLGLKDWELMEYVIQEDFILVTRNAQDFRGAGKVDQRGQNMHVLSSAQMPHMA